MRKLLPAIVAVAAMAAVPAYATVIGHAQFSDGQYAISSTGGLSLDSNTSGSPVTLAGNDYYATAYGYYGNAYVNVPADPNATGHFYLDYDLGNLGSGTWDWGVHSFAYLASAYDTCVDYAESGGVGFGIGLKNACFTSNVLNYSDLPANNQGSGFGGSITLRVENGQPNQAVPEPAAIALFGFGLLALGFVSTRRRGEES